MNKRIDVVNAKRQAQKITKITLENDVSRHFVQKLFSVSPRVKVKSRQRYNYCSMLWLPVLVSNFDVELLWISLEIILHLPIFILNAVNIELLLCTIKEILSYLPEMHIYKHCLSVIFKKISKRSFNLMYFYPKK